MQIHDSYYMWQGEIGRQRGHVRRHQEQESLAIKETMLVLMCACDDFLSASYQLCLKAFDSEVY